jgi:hypothetical protein
VLNYVVTCNHIHLLVKDTGRNVIAQSMQLIAGRTAQEYNQRKARGGAFREDRYHATAIFGVNGPTTDRDIFLNALPRSSPVTTAFCLIDNHYERSRWLRNLPKCEKVIRAIAINSVTKITSRYTSTRMYGSSGLGTSAQLAWKLPLSKS